MWEDTVRRAIATAVPLPSGQDHAAVLRSDPEVWLPDARPQGLHRWQVQLSALGWSRPVVCEVGPPITTRAGTSRRLVWEPATRDADVVQGDRWLPGFDGTIRLVGGDTSPSLLIAGDVERPLGVLGAALDAVALGPVADRSLDDLLQRISARIVEAGAPAVVEHT